MESANSTYDKRKTCIKKLYKSALDRVCLFERIEKKHDKIITAIAKEIVKTMRSIDNRVVTEYDIKKTGNNSYELFANMYVGYNNPSLYICKSGKVDAKIIVEAETKKILKNLSSKLDGLYYLNVDFVITNFHATLVKAVQLYTQNNEWKNHKCNFGLHSVGLSNVNTTFFCLANNDDSKKINFLMKWIPTVAIPNFCIPFVKQWLGPNVPCLVAVKNVHAGEDPSLDWSISYHLKETEIMKVFPINFCSELFYSILIFIQSDPVLKTVSRGMIKNVFFQELKFV